MISVRGAPFCGDQTIAKVSLRLSGLTEGRFYLLGDQLAGELTIIPHRDIQLQRINFQLDFIIRGNRGKADMRAARAGLLVPDMLKGGKSYRFPVRIPHYFSRPGFKGKHLVSYYRLNVFLDYDPKQFDRSFTDRIIQTFSDVPQHGSSFEIPVRYGMGTYRVAPRKLPIRLVDLGPLMKPTFILPFIFLCWIMGIAFMTARPEDMLVMPVLVLVLFAVWLLLRLSTFQMTPMEIKPLRDGQLRLRILDRGNDQLKGAMVGYRLLECYMVRNGKSESKKKSIYLEKEFSFAEVARREEHLYEAVLPWPEAELPTTGGNSSVWYEWAVFLKVPNPMFGDVQEKSWPLSVTWERLRLIPLTEEELKLEDLDRLKMKQLARLNWD
jgi:hypothetical protein